MRPARLPIAQFWGLCFVVFMTLQIPIVRMPVMFLSTWSHEMGHGIGAMITGGQFDRFALFSNFSGVAYTRSATDFQRVMTLCLGLLGPSLLGSVLILLTRGLNWTRVGLFGLTLALLVTQLWAGDMFTRLTLAVAAGAFGLCAWKLPPKALSLLANIVAIAFCLTALTGFGYFFIGNADVSGSNYRSDTGHLSDILGGPYWLWGALLVIVSITVLLLSVILAEKMARRFDRASAAGDTPRTSR